MIAKAKKEGMSVSAKDNGVYSFVLGADAFGRKRAMEFYLNGKLIQLEPGVECELGKDKLKLVLKTLLEEKMLVEASDRAHTLSKARAMSNDALAAKVAALEEALRESRDETDSSLRDALEEQKRKTEELEKAIQDLLNK